MAGKRKFVTTRAEYQWDGPWLVETLREGYWYDGPWTEATPGRDPTYAVGQWKFYQDSGNPGSTQLAAVNTNANITADTKFRLRVVVGETNNANQNHTGSWVLQFQVNGTGGYGTVATGIGSCRAVTSDSGSFTDGNMSQLLTLLSGSTYNTAFDEAVPDNAPSIQTWADASTEYEFCLTTTGLSEGDYVEFRVLDPASVAQTFASVPRITIPSASTSVEPGAATITVQGQQPTPFVEKSSSDTASVAGTEAPLSEKTISTIDAASITTTATADLVGGATIVTPAQADITVAGQQPTLAVTAEWAPTPAQADITLAGQQPTVGQEVTTAPAAGEVTLAGQAPTVGTETTVAPSEATIAVAGQAPTVAPEVTATPGAATITVAGQAPTVDTGATIVTPAQADLVVEGLVPTLAITAEWTLTPDAAVITVQGQAPTVDSAGVTPKVASDTASITATEAPLSEKTIATVDQAAIVGGDTAVLDTGAVLVTPAQADITVAGQAVTVGSEASATPDQADLVVQGQAPTVLSEATVTPDQADVTVQGQAPSVESQQGLTPTQADLVVQGQAPTLLITVEWNLAPDAATITVEGQPPTVHLGDIAVVQPDFAAVTVLGQLPTVTSEYQAKPNAAGITVAGQLPAVVSQAKATAGAPAAITVEGQEPTLAITVEWALTPSAAELTITGFAPAVGVVTAVSTVVPGYADVRLLVDDSTRPWVGIGGENDKWGTDTASIVATEAPLSEKTISIVDLASIDITGEEINQYDLESYDDADSSLVESPAGSVPIYPGAGLVTLDNNLQPVVQIPPVVYLSPNPAAVSLLGGAVTVISRLPVAPGAGTVSVAGQQAGITSTFEPGVAELSVDGPVPEITAGDNYLVSSDTASITAREGMIYKTLDSLTDTASITATGVMTGQDRAVTPGAGTVTVAGLAPAVTARLSIAPGAATVCVEGQPPAVSVPGSWNARPTQADITVAGLTPFAHRVVFPTPSAHAAILVQGQAPAVNFYAYPDHAHILVGGDNPLVWGQQLLYPDAALLEVEGLTVTIRATGDWLREASASAAWVAAAGATGSWTDASRGSGTWTETAGASLTWEQTAGASLTWRD